MSSPMPEANLLYNKKKKKKTDSLLDLFLFFKLYAYSCNSDLRIIHQKHASHHNLYVFQNLRGLT